MKKYAEMIFSGFWAIVGVFFLLLSFLYLSHFIELHKNAEELEGEISAIEEIYVSNDDVNHIVYVDFSYNGTDYKHKQISLYRADMYVGKEITLLYNPEYPDRVSVPGSSWILIAGMGIMGIICAGLGLMPWIKYFKRKKEKQQLLTDGRKISAVVNRVSKNKNHTVNGKNPYIIYCSYLDESDGKVYCFESEELWEKPKAGFSKGRLITVIVNQSDYGKYYVKTEEEVQSGENSFA